MNMKSIFLTCGILLLTALLQGAPISEYVIYYENSVPPSVKTAAADLQKYIRKSTGVELEIVHSPVAGMIALGDNPSLRKIGIDPDSFAYEEFIIRTVGKDLFIAGRDLKNGRTDTASWLQFRHNVRCLRVSGTGHGGTLADSAG